nr:MAG TPA: Head Tail Connector Protein [Caudoviricetes sp.]
MADYSFYAGTYLGDSITEEQFPRLAKRAENQLARYKRIYTVTAPDTDSEDMALCAMADAIYYFETAAGGVTSSSIGSVSSSSAAVDSSPKAQSRELYRCACLYLDIYRGGGPC